MRRYMEKLELTYKSVRIRNIQRMLNIVQIILVVVLSLVILMISGVSFKPFYFPLDFLFFFLLIMLLVFSIETILFRFLEIRFSKSDSAIYLMAKNSTKTAAVLLIVSILIMCAPLMVNMLRDQISNEGQITYGQAIYFASGDKLALTVTDNIRVVAQGGTVDIYLIPADEFNASNLPSTKLFSGQSFILQKSLFGIGYKEFALYVQPATGNPLTNYKIEVALSPYVINFIPALALISTVAQGLWIAYLYPVVRKYASRSIYCEDYAGESRGPRMMQVYVPKKQLEGQVLSNAPELPAQLHPTEEVVEVFVDVDATLTRARTSFNAGNYPGAIKDFDEVLEAEPSNTMALSGKARALEMLNLPADALASYDRLLEINPNVEPFWIKTGDILRSMGRNEEAAARYQKALKLNSESQAKGKLATLDGDANKLVSYAQELFERGNHTESLYYFEMALTKDGENIRAHIGRGKVLRELKRFDESEAMFNKAMETDCYNSTALDGLLTCLSDKLDINPKDEKSLLAKGDLLLEIGRRAEALELFNKILEFNPESSEAKIRIEDMREEQPPAVDEREMTIQELLRLPVIGRARAKALIEAGFDTLYKIGSAKVEELTKVKGISERLARNMITAAAPTV